MSITFSCLTQNMRGGTVEFLSSFCPSRSPAFVNSNFVDISRSPLARHNPKDLTILNISYGDRSRSVLLPPSLSLSTGIFQGEIIDALRPEPPFTGVSGPSGPKSQKSLKKGLLGDLEKSLKKYPKKSQNIDFRTFLGIFALFLDFFGYFSRLFSRPPKKTLFETFWRFRARRARRLL